MTYDAATEQRRDWQEFLQIAVMTDHWQRPGWVDGRQAYYWFLTFGGATELHKLAARCRPSLHVPYLDLVPLDRLHLTVRRLAFADEVQEEVPERAANLARSLCAGIGMLRFQVGPLTGSAGAVRLSAAPAAPIALLRERLATVGTILGVPELRTKPFRPHVGVAYCNSRRPAVDVIRTVEPLRSLPAVEVTVPAVDLVRLTRRAHAYEWDTVVRIPLSLEGPDSR